MSRFRIGPFAVLASTAAPLKNLGLAASDQATRGLARRLHQALPTRRVDLSRGFARADRLPVRLQSTDDVTLQHPIDISPRCFRHFALQKRTCSQSRAHFARHLSARPHFAQVFAAVDHVDRNSMLLTSIVEHAPNIV